ncbi:MAG: FAD-binding protein [Defluviitaleaceae bacterium]|nr:FAD-binding protein [Defluviitaleaceae bacterium]
MTNSSITVNGLAVPVITLDTAVVGSGCAGFNAADWLYAFGRTDVAVVTEGVSMGTSRNTGSDKQTYYKLSLSGGGGDSVASMADDLFAGGGVNGDTARSEAAGSVRSFIKLCNLGVPFPANEYGEYVGYKTDHDPRARATSAGPLTSRMMTEALERAVKDKGIPILDGLMAFQLLTSGNGENSENSVQGLLCLDKASLAEPSRGLTVVRARQVILATGGPAGCYARSVYPESQTGMSGMALEAGAEGANLQEWQYGLASLKFRWNVSGTYQQVLPRYISVDENGVEREFLTDYFDDSYRAMDMVFLKGYQWPFDTNKLGGSSLIDVIVHHETATLGRRVYMDFRRNPSALGGGLERDFDGLGEEARRYLTNSGALFGVPIERLEAMNRPAIDLYKEHGIDLYAEPLEVGVCAQHHNGGLAVDANWRTSIRGLYAAGEAAGTFGTSRPGGSALNSGQVGALRAAEHIAYGGTPRGDTDADADFIALAAREAEKWLQNTQKSLRPGAESNILSERRAMSAEMSRCAGHLRDAEAMSGLERRLARTLVNFYEYMVVADARELPELMKTRDIFITQLAALSAMRKAASETGSRGSALVIQDDGIPVLKGIPVRYQPQKALGGNMRMATRREEGGFASRFEPVRPIPQANEWFETVWSEYRKRMALAEKS